jgi:mannitol-1-phosphate 5-dehydrogenase
MRALVFGAGRIGCGFAAPLLQDSGFSVSLVARNPTMLHYLGETHRYLVELVHNSDKTTRVVEDVACVDASDGERLTSEIEASDLVVTAVGAGNLPTVAKDLAPALCRRRRPLTVIAIENLANAGPYLQELTLRHCSCGGRHEAHSFTPGLVDRIVPELRFETRERRPSGSRLLVVRGEPRGGLVVDGSRLLSPLPKIQGMTVARDYQAYLHRKLYIFSAGHAACAYLGYLKGYRYVHAAVRDPEIRAAVLECMREGQRGVRAHYGTEIAGTERDLHEILERFDNAALNDPVVRVARDPLRKLGADDRLVGAATLAQEAGVPPHRLALAMAAALQFGHPADPAAAELRRDIAELHMGSRGRSLATLLNRVSHLDPQRGLGRYVVGLWRTMASGWKDGNVLLSLDRRLWSWR